MKKDNRKQYLQTWLNYLKRKTEINYKELAKLLEKKFKDHYSGLTLKRYSATLIGNLLENGYISGKKGRGATAKTLPIVKAITLPVLDKCLPRDFKKVHFEEKDLTPVGKKQASFPPKKAKKKRATAPKKKIKAASVRQKTPKRKKAKLPVLRVSKGERSQSEQSAFYLAQQLAEHIGELESRLAAYDRIFEKLSGLFSLEILEMEKWIEKKFVK